MQYTKTLSLGCTLGFLLACSGGVSVDPEAHFATICDASGFVPNDVALVQLDLPVKEMTAVSDAVVGGSRLMVNGWDAGDFETLKEMLVERAMEATDRASRDGEEEVPGLIQVMIEPDVPATRAVETMRAVQAAGFTEVDLAFWSLTPYEPVAYPDPDYGEELSARLKGESVDIRVTEGAEALEGLTTLCPGARRSIEAVAAASPEAKCELLGRGMGEALPACPLSNGDRIITVLQVMGEVNYEWEPTALSVVLDEAGLPIQASPGTTWSDLAPTLMGLEAPTIWFAEPEPEPEPE